MSIKKTYIPAKPRSSKLVGTSMSGGVAGSVSSSSTDPNAHSHSNKVVLDKLTDGDIDVLGKLSLDEDGNIKVDATLWATGGISALGLGSGGGGGDGGADMLDSWTNYTEVKANYYIPASLLVPFRNDTLSRLTSLESGSATSIVTTGNGNAITSLTKSGSEITANKGLIFALASHTHAIAQITGLQDALDAKQDTLIAGTNITISGNTISASGGMSSVTWGDITGKPTTFAPSAHTHTIANVTGLQDALDSKEPSFTKNTAFNKDFGTVVETVAQGNDSRINNGQTAFGWGNHASAGYALNSALTVHINKNDNPHAVTKSQVGLGNVDNVKQATQSDIDTAIDNIGVVTHIDNKENPHEVTTSQIGAVDLTTNQTITGAKTFSNLITASAGISTSTLFASGIITAKEGNSTNWNKAYEDSHTHTNKAQLDVIDQELSMVSNVGFNSAYIENTIEVGGLMVNGKSFMYDDLTMVEGTIKANNVDFGNGFTIEPSGTELVFKYSGVVKQRMFQDGSFVATGGVAAFSQGVEADTLDLLRLKLNQGGGDSKYLSSTATQIYFDIGGATPLSMTKTEVRRGNTDNNVNLGTSAYPWVNIYGVNLIASTDISTPKITLGNGWTIEQTSASLTIRRNGVIKGTFTA